MKSNSLAANTGCEGFFRLLTTFPNIKRPVKSLPKVLLFGLLGVLALGALALLLTQTVTYHPFGVPKHQREQYRKKVAAIQQYAELAKQADQVTRPVAVTNETVFNFGMVDPHSTISHPFVIHNEGELPLRLSVQETSCKCTVGKLGTKLLLPGEQTDITMTWNTGYQADTYEQTATIATNDPLRESIELTVKGVVRAECIVPDEIVFGTSDPGKPAETTFEVYSQLWDDFEVGEIDSDLKGFQWSAEPIAPEDVALVDADAKSAWRVRVTSSGNQRGKFSGDMKLTIKPNSGTEAVMREMSASGKVRAPVSFYSPDIHKTEGLDIGTLVAGKEYLFHLIVRSRGQRQRDLDVLDVKPDQLEAFVKPLPSQPGSYRLTLKVPEDCEMVVFNRDSKHGYVHVGDPNDKAFSNWFPVMGAVVEFDE